MDNMNQNNPDLNNTGFNNYTQNDFNNYYMQPSTMEQLNHTGYFFATDNNGSSASYSPYTTDNNYEQQLQQQPEQSMLSFTNNETQSLPYMPQHQYNHQNLSLPFNTMIADPSQTNNSESVINFEIPGFKIKIIVTPTLAPTFPYADLNQFQHAYSNTFANN